MKPLYSPDTWGTHFLNEGKFYSVKVKTTNRSKIMLSSSKKIFTIHVLLFWTWALHLKNLSVHFLLPLHAHRDKLRLNEEISFNYTSRESTCDFFFFLLLHSDLCCYNHHLAKNIWSRFHFTGAFSDVREPISLHQAVLYTYKRYRCLTKFHWKHFLCNETDKSGYSRNI